MLALIRLGILIAVPLLFVGAYELWPQIVDKEPLRFVAAVFSIVWAGVLWIFARLADVAKVEGLGSRERERLQYVTAQIRHRLWWISGVCAAAAAMLLLLSLASPSMNALVVAIAAGVLLGIAGSYLFVVPFWHDELQRFIDQVRDREERRKALERALKDLPGSA